MKYKDLKFQLQRPHKGSELNLDSKNGLIQGISDNFDAHLSTQNGLKQTHSLATIITQFGNTGDGVSREPVGRRLGKWNHPVCFKDCGFFRGICWFWPILWLKHQVLTLVKNELVCSNIRTLHHWKLRCLLKKFVCLLPRQRRTS